MKVLYLGHYREGTGWAKAAQDLILALDSVGVDVVCRNIAISRKADVPERLQYLETGNTKGVDYCIQHILPIMYIGTSKFKKNIGYTVLETKDLQCHPWIANYQLMSDVWVPCQDNLLELNKCGINNVSVVPHAFDIDSYTSDIKDFDFSAHNIDGTYKFYTIADLTTRKNIEGTLRAYYSAFTNNENVCLVLKVGSMGRDKQYVYKEIKQIADDVKNKLNIYSDDSLYAKVIIIADHLDDKEILSLHKTCDCFIGLSHGEAWSIPAFDAMCMGNHPICTKFAGPKEFIDPYNKDTGTLIDVVFVPCNNRGAALSDIYTGKESWAVPSERQAIDAMRSYYTHPSNTKVAGLSRGQNFSHKIVGAKMKELLLK